MTAAALSYEQPHRRAARLAELGLTEKIIVEIAERGLVARRTCTPFDPPSFPGTLQWATMHRASRELLQRLDWTRDDSHNFSRVVSPDGAVAITIATGDDFTGTAMGVGARVPSTKYPKGTETDLAIVVNKQLSFFDEPIEELETDTVARPVRQTWWLLTAVVGKELRFELSCPEAQDEKGYIVDWSERIIFDPIPLDQLDLRDDDEPGPPAIEVPVERL
jgi:hypothetical protein